ncbi:MAG TPA: DUF2252 family protein [bacterium]
MTDRLEQNKEEDMNKSRHLLIFSILTIGLAFFACKNSAKTEQTNALYTDPTKQNFSSNPDLRDRIRSGPHGYFRFINKQFAGEVCRRFEAIIADNPSVNLHGDAHIEQYAVTDLGRGLTDYDDSASGPGIIDLVRFGVSLRLACHEQGWAEKADDLSAQFLRGYREALEHPETEAPEPEVVKRIRSEFTFDRESYLSWVDSVMQPVSAEERTALWEAILPYVGDMSAENPDLNANYFDVKKIGYLRMGIGSALDIKYLFRVEGPSNLATDDVILECKQVRDLSGIPCITSGKSNDPFRVLIGQARIAYEPFHHLGYFTFRGITLWVHSWVDNYKEVKIGQTFRSIDEMAEVAYDVGVQLGRGHVKHIGDPLELQIRRKQLEIIRTHETDITQACRELEALTIAAWQEFCTKL